MDVAINERNGEEKRGIKFESEGTSMQETEKRKEKEGVESTVHISYGCGPPSRLTLL